MAASAQQVAMLGGTFDPPHLGHLALARGVADEFALKRLYLVPTGNPHFKLGEDVTPVAARVAMTRLLAAEDDRFEVSTIEADRPGVTYTVDTLRKLKQMHPASPLVFVIGGDCAEHIWRWRAAEQIAELCTVVAVARHGYDFSDARRAIERSGIGFDMRWLHLDIPDISSTAVREKARAGEDLAGFVPESVGGYICEHHLYR